MADIFVSYAKADRPLALKLAAMLEAEGWKVWWDTSLIPGDDFRNEIMTELGRARAVIVIWTDASIKSDWVRSEAGRAQADRKLIPVKLPHLTYKDLPPPFDVLHTENISETDKIRAAVVAQLAKPAVEPSAVALLAKGFKWELLTWWGIIGGAITLFVAISTTLKLADWARVLVDHWKEWTHAFWVWVFGWLGIHLPPGWTPVLSFLVFGSSLIIGQAIQFNRMIRNQSAEEKYESYNSIAIPLRQLRPRWSDLLELGDLLGFMVLIPLVVGGIYFAVVLAIHGLPSHVAAKVEQYWEHYSVVTFLPLTMIPMIPRHKLHAGLAICLLVVFWTIITFNQITMPLSRGGYISRIAFAMIEFLPPILLLVAPAKAVSRRLIFLALGLILLIALNELSKLGLDVTAPKLQG
jgi:TIR domain